MLGQTDGDGIQQRNVALHGYGTGKISFVFGSMAPGTELCKGFGTQERIERVQLLGDGCRGDAHVHKPAGYTDAKKQQIFHSVAAVFAAATDDIVAKFVQKRQDACAILGLLHGSTQSRAQQISRETRNLVQFRFLILPLKCFEHNRFQQRLHLCALKAADAIPAEELEE